MSKSLTADSEKIRRRIKKLGYQKQFIAEQINCTPSELSHIIRGKRKYPKKRAALMVFLNMK